MTEVLIYAHWENPYWAVSIYLNIIQMCVVLFHPCVNTSIMTVV